MNDQINITGTEMAYLYICERKLWLFHHGIRPENEHVNVQIGRFVQETTFARHDNKKELQLGEIGVVDWAELDKGIIHETKKGKAPRQAEDAQVSYYLWWMRCHGLKVDTCIVHYPKQKKTRKLKWTTDMEKQVEADLEKARSIVKILAPPEVTYGRICQKCAFEEYCFV